MAEVTKRGALEDIPCPVEKKILKTEEATEEATTDIPSLVEDKNIISKEEATKEAVADDSTAVGEESKVNSVEDEGSQFRVLVMKSVPLYWSKADIDSHVKRTTQSNEEIHKGLQFIFMECTGNKFNGTCHVRFATHELCKLALSLLKKDNFISNGQKIWYTQETKDNALLWLPNNKPDVKAMSARHKKLQKLTAKPQKQQYYKPYVKCPRVQSWQENYDNYNYNYNDYNPTHEQDEGGKIFQNNMILIKQNTESHDTYGLSSSFLSSLRLTTPLTAKVFVDQLSNEYDDETKIRALFSHAGTVVSVAVITRVADILKLKVEFDHPVEAVQAITMFHDQELFGKKLIVRMDCSHNAYKTFLPKGLKAFGPGLGFEGRAIKNVRNTIELQKAINMIMNEIATIKNQYTESIDEYQETQYQETDQYLNDQYQNYQYQNAQYQNDQYQGNDQYQETEGYQGNEYENGSTGAYPTDQYKANNENKTNANPSSSNENQTMQPQLNHQPQITPPQPQVTTSTPAVNNTPAANVQDSFTSHSLANQNNPMLALGALLNPQASQMLQLFSQQNAGTNLLVGTIAPQTQDISQAHVMAQMQMVSQAQMIPPPQIISLPQMIQQPQILAHTQMISQPLMVAQPQTTSQQQMIAQSQTTSQQQIMAQPQTSSQQQMMAQPQTISQQQMMAQPQTTSQQQMMVQPQTTSQQQMVAQPQTISQQQIMAQPQSLSQLQMMAQPQMMLPPQINVPPPQLQMNVPPPQLKMHVPPPQSQINVPLPQSQMNVPPPQKQMNVPPPQSQMNVPPPQSQMNVPPPQSQMNVPPPQSQMNVPSPQSQMNVPPPQSQMNVPPPQSQMNVPPPLSQMNVPPPLSQMNVPPPQTQMNVPPPQSQMIVPSPLSQMNVPPPRSQMNVPPPQSQMNVPCPVKKNPTRWSGSVPVDAKNMPAYSNSMATSMNLPPSTNTFQGKDATILCTVMFSCLPTSVTSAALTAKMREIGSVRAVEMAGPSRALVIFHSSRDADSCIKLFHNSKVDGQVIEARRL